MKQLLYCLLVLLVGCKQRYDSPVHSPVTGYLVVDGVINSGPGMASITLSRTSQFNNTNIVYEAGAAVSLQADDSSVYLLTERGQGVYAADSLNLNTALRYRLRITASDGKQYLSDFVAVINNPPIDSISWKQDNTGVQLYINTHNPQNNTRYYQWMYDETWEFHSPYLQVLKYQILHFPDDVEYSVVYKDSSTYSFDPTIATCWQFNVSSSLFLGSTATLSEDKVYLPLLFIPHASIKLAVLYSVHLKQYAWTKEGYQFLENMKKNTESTGTVFDPQPSELKGNIRCVTDANEPVVGFFNICPGQEARIFIKNSDLSDWGYVSGCTDTEIDNISDSIKLKGVGLTPTVIQKHTPLGGIATFRAASAECVDCTLTGTNIKPAYWP